MMQTRDPNDPKGLIREAYAIDGITAPECRSIFLDWALSMPSDMATDRVISALLDHYGRAMPDHPMTVTLSAGRGFSVAPVRRGGRAARV